MNKIIHLIIHPKIVPGIEVGAPKNGKDIVWWILMSLKVNRVNNNEKIKIIN